MKLFKKVKEIKSSSGELHFLRFAIFECSFFAIYIHRIYRADKDPFCHTHPWNFFGVVLKGGYIERMQFPDNNSGWWNLCKENFLDKKKSFLSIGYGGRKYLHKILKVSPSPVTTLFCTFGRKQPWHFYIDNQFVESSEYIKNKSKYNQ